MSQSEPIIENVILPDDSDVPKAVDTNNVRNDQEHDSEEVGSQTQMTRSIEELIKKSIHSNSSPVIRTYNNKSSNVQISSPSSSAAEEERQRRQQELLDSLAQQHLAERAAAASSVRGSTRGGVGAPTMSIRSNYSEFVLNGSGLGDQSYSLDFSAQHTATNPSYSSYGASAGDIDLPYEQQQLRVQEQLYREERRTMTTTTNTTNNFYQDVIAIDDAPPIYVPSSATIGGRGVAKSATDSYNSYKSLKTARNCLPPPANCEIKPVWILTKVTRYITRTIRREKVSPQ